MTQAIDIPTGATTALPALSSMGSGTMTVPIWSIVVLLVGLAMAIGWALYARAVRVDRLHRQVLGARATLEAQLVHRAEAAAELATVPALDPASGLLLSRAAREALDAEGPVAGRRGAYCRRRPGHLRASWEHSPSFSCSRWRSAHRADHSQSGPYRVRSQPGPANGGLRARAPRAVRRPAERAGTQPSGPGLLPPGPGPQVPQHPRQRGPGAQGTATRPDVSPGRARPHAPDLRCRRRHHPRDTAGPRRRGATEVNQ